MNGGKHERQWDAGKARAGTRIVNMFGVSKQPPWHHRIDDMFDGCLARIQNASQD